jgi:DNA-binding response OmpR family regulator
MRHQSAPRPRQELTGQRVLLVEDEALVAMLVEDSLQDAGATVLGPASTVDEALALIETGGVDAAVLDLNLRGEPVTRVADRLEAMKVPFVITTGYGAECAAAQYVDAPMLQKPFDLARLTSALVAII